MNIHPIFLTSIIVMTLTVTAMSQPSLNEKLIEYYPTMEYKGNGMYQDRDGKLMDIDTLLKDISIRVSNTYLTEPTVKHLGLALTFYGDFGGDSEMFLDDLQKVYLKDPKKVVETFPSLAPNVALALKSQFDALKEFNNMSLPAELLPKD